MNMVNIAVIGSGIIGKVHAWAAAKSGKSKLVACVDTDRPRAEALAKEYGGNAECDYRRVLDDKNVHAVSIGTPHFEHAQMYFDAIAAGKHVICEKPLTTTPENLYTMIDISKARRDLVITGVFQHRFSPITRAIQKRIADGAIGKITSGSVDFECTRTREYYGSDAWRGKWKFEGGGMLINQAIHTIDSLSLFFGRPVAVDARVERRRMDTIEVEDYADGVFEYPGGVKLKFHAENVPGNKWGADVHINGEKGSIAYDSAASHKVNKLETPDSGFRRALDEAEKEEAALFAKTPGKAEYGSFHDLQFLDFIEAILEDRRPRFEIADVSIANEIVLAMYHSTATGKRVALPIGETYRQPLLEIKK
ncbi:MAG: Gfo/Idh/MocA family oxidoreductase [Spirochaetota bacterium]